MAKITVRKHSWEGLFRYAWQGEVLARDGDLLLVQATWNGPGEPLVGEICFAAGDCFLEYYYLQRPYAIWEVRTAAHVLKGWYCNITRPAVISADSVRWEDLALDLWVATNGDMLTLDEDEFEVLPIDAETRQYALDALAALRQRVERHESPFDVIGK